MLVTVVKVSLVQLRVVTVKVVVQVVMPTAVTQVLRAEETFTTVPEVLRTLPPQVSEASPTFV